jgi:hypothetical protein
MSLMDQIKNTAPADTGFKLVPQGDYVASLQEIKVDKTSNPEVWTAVLQIVKGDSKGSKLFKNWRMNDQSLPYFLNDTAAIGIDAKEYSDELKLINDLQAKAGVLLDVHVKHSQVKDKTFANAYINGLVDESTLDLGVDSSEEIPF